jgi:hypothetical protein
VTKLWHTENYVENTRDCLLRPGALGKVNVMDFGGEGNVETEKRIGSTTTAAAAPTQNQTVKVY